MNGSCGGLPLARGEVVVWLQATRAVSPSARAALEALLDPEERARAAVLFRAEDREVFVHAHALLRAVLSRHAPAPPESWKFARGPAGKPELCGSAHGALRFNLSHAEGLAAVVVASGMDVGMDVEEERPRPRLEIARRFFARSELALLCAAPALDQPDLFLELWTLKEAFLKARGGGLQLPLHDFAFSVNGNERNDVKLEAPAGERAEDWFFRTWRPDACHRASVAIRAPSPPPPRVRVRWLRAEDVLSGAEGTCEELPP